MLTIANPPKPWFGWRSLDLSRSKPGVGKNWVNTWGRLVWIPILVENNIHWLKSKPPIG
jgi:hypothetical protein